MENIDIKVTGKKMVITIDISKEFGLSKSEKSRVIATSGGNVSVPGHEEIKLGLNCYTAA